MRIILSLLPTPRSSTQINLIWVYISKNSLKDKFSNFRNLANYTLPMLSTTPCEAAVGKGDTQLLEGFKFVKVTRKVVASCLVCWRLIQQLTPPLMKERVHLLRPAVRVGSRGHNQPTPPQVLKHEVLLPIACFSSLRSLR